MQRTRLIGLFPGAPHQKKATESYQKERETKTIIAEVNKDLSDSLNEFMKAENSTMEKELLSNGFKPEEIASILEEIKLKAHAVLIQQLNQKVKELKTEKQRPDSSLSNKSQTAGSLQKTIR